MTASPLPDLSFDDIAPPKKHVPVTDAELDALARSYATELPARYAEFMKRWGPGTYFKELYVYPLAEVRKVTDDLVGSDYFGTEGAGLWENTWSMLAREETKRLVILGHSLSGDWLGFVGGAPERILVFPRNGADIVNIGPTFGTALGCFCRNDADE